MSAAVAIPGPWLQHSGGKCPVEPNAIVVTSFHGFEATSLAKDVRWELRFAYRVIGTREELPKVAS